MKILIQKLSNFLAMTNTKQQPTNAEDDADNFFLPDFCHVHMVFAVVVIGELLAIILALAPMQRSEHRWQDLAVISLFIQWVALLSAGILCLCRDWLSKMSDRNASTISYFILLTTTTVFSEGTYATIQWYTAAEGLALHIDFLISNIIICAIVSAVVLRYFYVQHHWGRILQAKSQARIQALHSRIRPHFLFNSLNTIASLTRSDPALAEMATMDLADLFRGSLSETSHEVSLAAEIELSKRYLHIERLRLGDRLKEAWAIDDLPTDALIPQLTLQPLIENAIYHGIEHLNGGGTIAISGKILHNIISINITNPVSDYTRTLQRESNKMAQENVALRLNAVYGEAGKIAISDQDGFYHLTISFPYITERT
jgi:two-component system sensor histidine kinase AlgZ